MHPYFAKLEVGFLLVFLMTKTTIQPLNYISHKYQVIIGNLDVTQAVENFSIQQPRADISSPYSWSGTLTLADTLTQKLAESLDDLINPARWAKGLHPVRFYFQVGTLNQLFCTLRIQEYYYNEDQGVASIELGDILTTLSYKSPAKDYKGLGFSPCTPVSVNTIVNAALLQAAVPNFVINVPGQIDVAPNKPNGNWIAWAQSYLGERGYFLYADNNEVVRTARYPTTLPADALISRARVEVEDYERSQSPDEPVERYIVTASPEKFSKCTTSSLPEVEEELGYILDSSSNPIYCLERRVTTYPTIKTNNQEKTKIIIEQALGSAFPTLYPGNPGMIIVERIDEIKTYDLQRRLVLVERYTDKPLSLLLPEEFPPEDGYTYLINNIEATVEEFLEASSVTIPVGNGVPLPPPEGLIRKKIKTTWTAFAIGLNAGTYTGKFGNGTQVITIPFGLDWTIAIKEKVIETWKGGGISTNPNTGSSCTCDRYKYKKRVYQRPESFSTDYNVVAGTTIPNLQLGALQLKSSLSKSSDDNTPPAWEVQEPVCPTCTDVVKGEATLLPVAYIPYVEKEREIQASTVQDAVEAAYLANLTGVLEWSRYHQRTISMPVPNKYLLDPSPFHRIDVHNGSFIVDNPIITLGDDGLEFAFIGNYIGAIPAIAPVAEAPLVFNLVG